MKRVETRSYGNVNNTPKGSGAVVGEDGADLVLAGEINSPCVDLCALDVVRGGGGAGRKGCGGNVLDAGKSEGKRVVVVVNGDDLEPAGEGEGEDCVRANVACTASDQYSLCGENVSRRRGKWGKNGEKTRGEMREVEVDRP